MSCFPAETAVCKIPLALSLCLGLGLDCDRFGTRLGTHGPSSACKGFEPQTKDLLKAVEGLKAHVCTSLW